MEPCSLPDSRRLTLLTEEAPMHDSSEWSSSAPHMSEQF